MKKVSLDTWIQLLGMVGVLGGLVFVAIELRQSQTIAIAGQIQARNQALLDCDLDVLSSENLLPALLLEEYGVASHRVDPSSLDPEMRAILTRINSWRVQSLINSFQQYELGLLPNDVWAQVEGRLQSWYASCFTRQFFNGAYPSVVRYVQDLPSECISSW